MGLVKIKKLDIYKLKDREILEKQPCAFCGKTSMTFNGASGYESHFSDSDFDCHNCGCSYPVGLFFPEKSLDECKEMMRRRAAGYYAQLKKDHQEKLEIITRIKKRLEMYEANFNPSKREKDWKMKSMT